MKEPLCSLEFRTLIEVSPVAIIVIKSNIIQYVNPKFLEDYGYDEATELLGRKGDIIYPAEVQESQFRRGMNREAGKPEPDSYETKAIRRDGIVFPIRVYAVRLPVFEEWGTLAFITDITELKEQEEQLQQYISELEKSYKIHKEAQKIGNMGHWDWNIIENTLMWSDQIFEIFEVDPRSFLHTYEAFLSFVHPDDRNYVKKAVDQALYQKKPYNIVHRICAGEKIKYVNEIASVEWDEFDKPVRMIGTVQDITLQKQTETKMIEAREQFRNLYNNAPVMYLVSDFETKKIVRTNNLVLDCLGYSREELLRKSLYDLFTTDGQTHLTNQILPRFIAEKQISNEEIQVLTKDGKVLDVIMVGTLITDTSANIDQINLVLRDITEMKKTREELEIVKEKLYESAKMEAIGRLAGGLAHDLNNMLTGIMGYTSLLVDGLPHGSKMHRYALEIEKTLNLTGDLVSRLLTFSRKQITKFELLDFNEIIREYQNLIEQNIAGSAVKITYDLNPVQKINADRVQLTQIIMNLVINSRDAIKETGEILIQTKNVTLPTGAHVLLRVSDNGCGMTPETRDRIFEPFFTRKKDGTGLGLATVYGIVKQHGGEIEVTSEVGKGTTMDIHFPVKSEEPSSDTPERKKIMIVDDNISICNMVSIILEGEGFQATCETDPYKAMKKIQDDPPDLLISDIIMPEMNGLALVERSITEGKPSVLFITGYTDEPLYRQIIDAGYPILQKPFNRKDLLEKLNQMNLH